MPVRTLRRLLPYVRPYRTQMAVMTLAALSALTASTAVPLVVKRVVDGPVAHHHHAGLITLSWLALALGVSEGMLLWLRRHVLASAATGMEATMRDDLYAHLQRLPVSFHDRWQSGQLLSRATTDLSVIRRFVGYGLVFLVVNTATLVGVSVLLVTLNPAMAALTALGLTPIGVAGARFHHRYVTVARRLQDQQGDLTTLVEEAATGIRIIKAFGRHDVVAADYRGSARVVRASAVETFRVRGWFNAVLGLVPNLILAVVLLWGAIAVSKGALSLGGLVAFISLLLMLVWPVESLGEILAMAGEAAAATERFFEVLDTTPDIQDRPGAYALAEATGRVRFDHVDFSYPGPEQTLVLQGIDVDIAPGETLALVGRTGSGKSTLISLMSRLYDVTAGRVTLDGVDVRDLQLDSLRRHVGVVFDEPTLFSVSVRENLMLGAPTATDADLWAALETAQATFVSELPWGLDTRIGEQGLTLSGGQRQRLALARAIVGRPRVLVLDDPLSAVDVHTEARIQSGLRAVLADSTVLLVAHRPSTVALADRVAFLDGGRVSAVGSHHELLTTVPAYRAVLADARHEMVS